MGSVCVIIVLTDGVLVGSCSPCVYYLRCEIFGSLYISILYVEVCFLKRKVIYIYICVCVCVCVCVYVCVCVCVCVCVKYECCSLFCCCVHVVGVSEFYCSEVKCMVSW